MLPRVDEPHFSHPPIVASPWVVSPTSPAAITNGSNNTHSFLTVWRLSVVEVLAELAVGGSLTVRQAEAFSSWARGERRRPLSSSYRHRCPHEVLPSGPQVHPITSQRPCLQTQSRWELRLQRLNPGGRKYPVHSIPPLPPRFTAFFQTCSLQPSSPKPELLLASNSKVLSEHHPRQPWVTLGAGSS